MSGVWVGGCQARRQAVAPLSIGETHDAVAGVCNKKRSEERQAKSDEGSESSTETNHERGSRVRRRAAVTLLEAVDNGGALARDSLASLVGAVQRLGGEHVGWAGSEVEGSKLAAVKGVELENVVCCALVDDDSPVLERLGLGKVVDVGRDGRARVLDLDATVGLEGVEDERVAVKLVCSVLEDELSGDAFGCGAIRVKLVLGLLEESVFGAALLVLLDETRRVERTKSTRCRCLQGG